jgi:HEPN domain-containing protein
MVDTIKFTEWFKHGDTDYKSAKILWKHDGDNSVICFLLQQTVEKYLKGYLIKNTGLLQQGHNTRKLCNIAKTYNSELMKYEKDCAFLNDFYIETRYPAEDPLIVSKDDVEECFKIADGIIEFIKKSII